jgi:glycosyltransferase involved in cell wall biosynthesis
VARLKIAVYTIALNEKKFVDPWYESAKDADYLLIADTGSTDGTVERARELGINVAQITVKPWRFDDARNASLALLPADIDFCVALDMDEVLVPGWREHLEKAPPGTTRPRYKYVWSWNTDGSEGLVYGADKVHARSGYRWVHPVHEVLAPTDGEETQSWVGMEVHHFPDRSKSRGQYLPLLKKAVDERPMDDRNAYYYARELFFYGQAEDARREFKRHLALPTATWRAERAASMRYLAQLEHDEAEAWLLRACAEAPEFREPWVELARHYYDRQSWEDCLSAARRALTITEKPLLYINDAAAWSSLPHDLASIGAWHAGQRGAAVEHLRGALRVEPGSERLQANLAMMLRVTHPERAVAVVPSRSNVEGCMLVLERLERDPQVSAVVLVADGDEACRTYGALLSERGPELRKVRLERVERGAGIHAMWNIGVEAARREKSAVALVNDDVTVADDTIGSLVSLLAYDRSLGLVCPAYDYRKFTDITQDVSTVCNGRYDGSGGLAGFCMVLAADIVQRFRFDESMKWWYGDNDVLLHVTRNEKRRAAITSLARCSGNSSATVDNDPPEDFWKVVQDDKLKFYVKWGICDAR